MELADLDGGIFYKIPDPSRFRGKRVIIVGGGDTALSHLQRLQGIASRITLVHRQKTLRSEYGAPEIQDGAVGTKPNFALFRDLGVFLDSKGQVVADPWQRTNIPRFLAIGDISSPLKMIVTAVAQAAVAAHQAYVEVRSPYWK